MRVIAAAEPQSASIQPRSRVRVKLATTLGLVPGLGQLYNRQPAKAAAFFFGVPGLFVLSLSVVEATHALLEWWRPRGAFMVVLSLFLQLISLLLFIGVFCAGLILWYGGLHDARASAQELRGEREPGGRWWWFRR